MLPIVVVSGLPCSGKTSLATFLRSRLNWPLLAKDGYKEQLSIGVAKVTREESKRLSIEAYALLFAAARDLAAAGRSFILEGNFRAGVHDRRFGELALRGATFVQAHCRAAPALLVRRFRERMSTRHLGHADRERQAEIEAELLTSRQDPLTIGGTVIDCESDDEGHWPQFAAEAILAAVEIKRV